MPSKINGGRSSLPSEILERFSWTLFHARVCVILCVCVCVCVCVCLRASTLKASSVWIRWDTREQINDIMLKTLNSYVDSLHVYFRIQNLTFQLSTLSFRTLEVGRATT